MKVMKRTNGRCIPQNMSGQLELEKSAPSQIAHVKPFGGPLGVLGNHLLGMRLPASHSLIN